MKYAIAAALLFVACAPVKPSLDTTEWAATQDSIFASPRRPTPAKAEAYAIRFAALYEAQLATGPTNLTIRHDLILTAPYAGRSDAYPVEALHGFRTLRFGLTWREGYSYFDYAMRGVLWYKRFAPLPGFEDRWQIRKAYEALSAPDGNLPLPEVSGGLGLVPGSGDTTVGPYAVYRDPGRYLLVVAGVDVGGGWNLHHHLETGYFALWQDTGWVVRCKPYTGWAHSDPFHEDGFYGLLPPGAVTPNAWRVDPPKITTDHGPGVYRFRWKNAWWRPASTREIRVGDTIVVRDTWGFFGSSEKRYP